MSTPMTRPPRLVGPNDSHATCSRPAGRDGGRCRRRSAVPLPPSKPDRRRIAWPALPCPAMAVCVRLPLGRRGTVARQAPHLQPRSGVATQVQHRPSRRNQLVLLLDLLQLEGRARHVALGLGLLEKRVLQHPPRPEAQRAVRSGGERRRRRRQPGRLPRPLLCTAWHSIRLPGRTAVPGGAGTQQALVEHTHLVIRDRMAPPPAIVGPC